MQEQIAISEQIFSGRGYDAVMHPGGRPSKRPRSEIGERLAQARERAGLSQTELAEKLKTTQTTIAYWERKATTFRSDVLVKLSEVLDVSADDLLGTGNGRRRAAKPTGKARQMFDAVSKLPRRQQEKVLAVLEPFVDRHGKETGTTS